MTEMGPANHVGIFIDWKKIERPLRNMLKRDHTNCKGDNICPWCHEHFGDNPNCDFEKIKNILGEKT